MIRNIVLVALKPSADPGAIAAIQDGFRGLNIDGTVSYTLGDDLGLKDGNWSFGIVADFTDEAAYRRYDDDAEHNRLRGLLRPHAEQIARVQFTLPS